MKPLADCLLYGFIDTAYLHGRAPESVARQLCDGGADLIQLRAKDQPREEIKRLAAKIGPLAAAAGVRLVINDYPGIAIEVGAPLCHLGQEDFFDHGFTHANEVIDSAAGGERKVSLGIGLSTHAPAQAERAIGAGAEYIAIGPIFATPTKPEAQPVTLEDIRWAAAHVQVPWFAIGGITLDNLDRVLAAGARRACIVSAILNAAELVGACQAFKDRLLSESRGRSS